MQWQRFLDRFVAATSYAAFVRALVVLPGVLVTGLIPLWITGVVVLETRMRGVQNVCALLAGQGLVSVVPLPGELGRGVWVLPSVLLYVSLIATLGWALDLALRQWPRLADAFASVFEQYIGLFAVSRATTAFTDASGVAAFYAVAFAYMVLPDAVAPCTDTLPPSLAASAWIRHWVRNMEGIAIRGASRGLLALMAAWATVGDGQIILQLLAVYLTGYDEVHTKLGHMHTLLSARLAQTLVGLLQSNRLSEWTCALGLASIVVVLAHLHRAQQKKHVFQDACAFGASLLLITVLERWLAGSALIEAGATYLTVFCLLEAIHDEPWSSASRGGVVMPAQYDLGFAAAIEDGLAIW